MMINERTCLKMALVAGLCPAPALAADAGSEPDTARDLIVVIGTLDIEAAMQESVERQVA